VKLAAVWWTDAHGDDTAWLSPDRPRDDDPYVVLSVGFLLDRKHGRKRRHVSVARSVSQEGAIDAVLHIPRNMVVKVVPLGKVEVTDSIKSAEVYPPGWAV